jgi:ornithine cyclodeaminase/alanine dehydrogenase-like protein (mu-crystallin family)
MAADRAAFRLGLVGAGRMGRTHLRAIAGSCLAQLAGTRP